MHTAGLLSLEPRPFEFQMAVENLKKKTESIRRWSDWSRID